MMKKTITLLALPLLLSSCGGLSTRDDGTFSLLQPKPFLMRDLPAGDDMFSRGFRDGCNALIGVTGNGMNRLYDGAPDPEFVADKNYEFGYNEGDRYCSVYVNKWITL